MCPCGYVDERMAGKFRLGYVLRGDVRGMGAGVGLGLGLELELGSGGVGERGVVVMGGKVGGRMVGRVVGGDTKSLHTITKNHVLTPILNPINISHHSMILIHSKSSNQNNGDFLPPPPFPPLPPQPRF
jgi:hypothetical protein